MVKNPDPHHFYRQLFDIFNLINKNLQILLNFIELFGLFNWIIKKSRSLQFLSYFIKINNLII